MGGNCTGSPQPWSRAARQGPSALLAATPALTGGSACAAGGLEGQGELLASQPGGGLPLPLDPLPHGHDSDVAEVGCNGPLLGRSE
jgi:hypothetical protein